MVLLVVYQMEVDGYGIMQPVMQACSVLMPTLQQLQIITSYASTVQWIIIVQVVYLQMLYSATHLEHIILHWQHKASASTAHLGIMYKQYIARI